MDIVTSVPVPFHPIELIAPSLEAAQERIQSRAREFYEARGNVDGFEMEDWLAAERELMVVPVVGTNMYGEDLFIEIVVPSEHGPEIAVYIGRSRVAIAADPDESGRPMLHAVDLPCRISLDGLDVERLGRKVLITAAKENS